VLWVADEYGQYLPSPTCPLIPIIETGNATETGSGANGTSPVNVTDAGNGTAAISAVKLFQGYRIPREH
jgi:alpha,alpha-trehalase